MKSRELLTMLAGGLPVDTLETSLLQFWRDYAKQFPQHSIFESSMPLSRTFPMYVHGDEGKHFKRSGIMILSMQSILGRAARPYRNAVVSVWGRKRRMAVNLGGHSFLSRFLLLALPRRYYSQRPEVFLQLFEEVITDFEKLQHRGFQFQHQTWYIQLLGLKGDLPLLTKSASLTRHYLRAARSEGAKEPAGMCMLCHAGKAGIPYEDFSDQAKWVTEPTSPPWATPPPFLRLNHIPNMPEAFLKFDLWHCLHGGVGMDFVASSVVEIMQGLLAPGSIPDKCRSVNVLLNKWIAKKNQRPHFGPFTAERVGLTSYQVCPDASWSKFDDTRILLQFVQDLLERHQEQINELGDESLQRILGASQTINNSLSILYRAGLWLTPEQAQTAGELGRRFLLDYQSLAVWAFKQRKQRYPLHQKMHYLDHIWRTLTATAARGVHCLNPLAESNQLDEDTCLVSSKVFS